jgi:tRNA(Ile2) C34 agmatinyltransferase TiaS
MLTPRCKGCGKEMSYVGKYHFYCFFCLRDYKQMEIGEFIRK